MSDRVDRVYHTKDEGQEYTIGARVNVITAGGLDVALVDNAETGPLRIVGYERTAQDGKKAIRIDLQRVS
jgi:hypothetical protein